MSYRNRDGSKLSFSELDKLRRERKSGGAPSTRPHDPGNLAAQKSYRAALEQAFDSGRLAEFAATLQRGRDPLVASERARSREPEVNLRLPVVRPADEAPEPAPAAAARPPADPELAERRKLTKQITSASAPRDVEKAIDRYLDRYQALPRDLDVLERALGHGKVSVVVHALESLDAWVAKQKPRRSRSLAAQLAILEDTHDDPEVRALAARVRAAL